MSGKIAEVPGGERPMPTLAEQLGAQNLVGRPPLRPGEPAADFALPALSREGTVSLADYRGQSGLLLAIERGLYCPFCRRHITQLGATARALKTLNVEVLAIVATPPERAKAYLRYRPAPVVLAADARSQVHRAYGLPQFPGTPEVLSTINAAPVNPLGKFAEPRPLREVAEALSNDDPYDYTDADQEAWNSSQLQTTGQFLIDRDGIVRWRSIEGEEQGLAGLTRYPSDDELLEAARSL
jgi:peroxiredoxin